MEPIILGYQPTETGTTEVTFGTKDFGQAVCRVAPGAETDPGMLIMLHALYDRQNSINTTRRRSAKSGN